MAKSRGLFFKVVRVLFLLALAFGIYYVVARFIIVARATVTLSNLGQIGRRLSEFRATRGRFPQGTGELDLQPDLLVDPMSGKDFIWAQKAPQGTGRVRLVWQPEPHRTEPWPFGGIRQLALFSDGSVGDCLPENTEDQ